MQPLPKGCKEVDGDIVGDDSYFPYDPYPDGWTTGDLFFGFGAPVSAIVFNDNTISIITQPGSHVGDPAIAQRAAGSRIRYVRPRSDNGGR